MSIQALIEKAERGEPLTERDLAIIIEQQARYCEQLDDLLDNLNIPAHLKADAVADKVLSYWYKET